MERKREREVDHLKQMIDIHKHMATLSVAGLLVTLNITTNLFDNPEWKMFAFASVAGFVACILSSVISQLSHIDKLKDEVIYIYPLKKQFAIPVAFSILGIIVGVISICFFVLLNWIK
jgi:hypothetical protein